MIYNSIDSFKPNLRSNLNVAKFYMEKTSLSACPRQLDNVYFCTTQKCGSQWVSSIFSDKRVKEITRLVTYPQHHYDINDFRTSFPRGAFVPGLYLNYKLYDFYIQKPLLYKTFYVYRNPMDLVVSYYWSAKEIHGLNAGVNIMRQRLNTLSQDEGLFYIIKFLGKNFSDMRSWIDLGSDDPKVMLVKFEDMVATPECFITDLFEFLGYEIENSIVQALVSDYSKKNMREKDLNSRQTSLGSHYRKTPSSHEEMFKPIHYDAFVKATGGLLDQLGYEM